MLRRLLRIAVRTTAAIGASAAVLVAIWYLAPWSSISIWWYGEEWHTARGQLTELEFLLRDYYSAHGSVPRRLEALLEPLDVPDEIPTYFPKWHRPSRELLVDPWGRNVAFETFGGSRCRLSSLGADGTTGGSRKNADIIEECRLGGPIRQRNSAILTPGVPMSRRAQASRHKLEAIGAQLALSPHDSLGALGTSVHPGRGGRVAQPFGFRPHRSEHAAFPHSAPLEGHRRPLRRASRE